MPLWAWAVIVVAAVVVAAVGIAVWRVTRSRRSGRLRARFGPEYERAVSAAPSQRAAEAELADRERRRDRLEIRPLTHDSARRYGEEWARVQARFVDDPATAVGQADRLVERVMTDRGYPMQDFEGQAELVSVDHPELVENYRAARSIYEGHERGDSSTEDLRQAMVHYRSLFEELLDANDNEGRADSRAPAQEVR
jgi:hypothetical protein